MDDSLTQCFANKKKEAVPSITTKYNLRDIIHVTTKQALT